MGKPLHIPHFSVHLLQMPGEYMPRESPEDHFNVTDPDHAQCRAMVADAMEELLDGAVTNILMARRLATWRSNQRPGGPTGLADHTSASGEIGGAVTSRGSQTEPPTWPIPGREASWAVSAPTRALLSHEVVKTALDRGVVALPALKSVQLRIAKPALHPVQPPIGNTSATGLRTFAIQETRNPRSTADKKVNVPAEQSPGTNVPWKQDISLQLTVDDGRLPDNITLLRSGVLRETDEQWL